MKALEKKRYSIHGMKNTKLYDTWANIIMRCTNKNTPCYDRYGERGIAICEEWRNSFIEFYNWSINNGYSDDLSIDRINNNGNYEPSNCRWVNKTIQARNTRILRKDNVSGYRGVGFNKNANKFQAHITVDRKQIYLGLYLNPKDGAIAYDKYVIENNLGHTTNGLYKKEIT